MCYLPLKIIWDTVANGGRYQILDSVNFYLSFPSLNWNNVTTKKKKQKRGVFNFPTCASVLTGFQLSHNRVRKAFFVCFRSAAVLLQKFSVLYGNIFY